MRNRESIVVALVGLNLILLASIILAIHEPPAAYAQRSGRPGDYLMATVQIHEDYAAMVVVNVPMGALLVFVPREQQGGVGAKLAFTGQRNLNADFGKR